MSSEQVGTVISVKDSRNNCPMSVMYETKQRTLDSSTLDRSNLTSVSLSVNKRRTETLVL